MSFKAKFKVAGKDLNVLGCHYSLHQEVDPTGRPSSITRGGKITITVESTGDTALFEWMTNSFERKDGSIVFMKRDSDATLKELKFKEGYLIGFETRLGHFYDVAARDDAGEFEIAAGIRFEFSCLA